MTFAYYCCSIKCVFLLIVIVFVAKQNNPKGLNPVNGISPNFYSYKKKFYRTPIILFIKVS